MIESMKEEINEFVKEKRRKLLLKFIEDNLPVIIGVAVLILLLIVLKVVLKKKKKKARKRAKENIKASIKKGIAGAMGLDTFNEDEDENLDNEFDDDDIPEIGFGSI